MTPLLRPFTLESTSDRRYEQRALIELLLAKKETVGNVRIWLSNACGLGAL